MHHELRKHELALVHGSPSLATAKNSKPELRGSNRDQTKAAILARKSLTYFRLSGERWDTTDPK